MSNSSEEDKQAQKRAAATERKQKQRRRERLEHEMDHDRIAMLEDKIKRQDLIIRHLTAQVTDLYSVDNRSIEMDEESESESESEPADDRDNADHHSPWQDGTPNSELFRQRVRALYDRYIHNVKAFTDALHCTPQEYRNYVEAFFLPYVHDTTVRGNVRQRQVHDVEECSNDKACLFTYLLYCATYPTLRHFTVAVLDHLDVYYTRKILHRVSCALERAFYDPSKNLRQHGRPVLPEGADLDWARAQCASMAAASMRPLLIAADGIGLPVRAPRGPDKAALRLRLFSSKNHRYETMSVIYVLLNGMYVHIEGPTVDAKVEQTLHRDGRWTAYAMANDQALLTDAGFTQHGANHVKPRSPNTANSSSATTTTTTTFTVPAASSSTSTTTVASSSKHADAPNFYYCLGPKTVRICQQVLLGSVAWADDEVDMGDGQRWTWRQLALQVLGSSKIASSNRSVVENALDRLRKYKILDTKFRQYGSSSSDALQLGRVLRGLAFVTNRLMLLNPAKRCRQPGWTPRILTGNYANVTYGYPGNASSGAAFGRYMSKKWDVCVTAEKLTKEKQRNEAKSRKKRKATTKKRRVDEEEDEEDTSDDAEWREANSYEEMNDMLEAGFIANYDMGEDGDFVYERREMRPRRRGRRGRGSMKGGRMDRPWEEAAALQRAERKK
jgi:hypothetical protein